MNRAILSGNVGADPQFKSTEKTNICNFRIAVNDKFKKDAPPQWFTITTFGKSADFVNSYIKKGTKVLVEGKIQMEEYTDKDNQKKLFVSIISDNIEILSSDKSAQTAKNDLMDSPAGNNSDDSPF
jgi:single-strand DNA-binding protein